jgi:hypothetical protein
MLELVEQALLHLGRRNGAGEKLQSVAFLEQLQPPACKVEGPFLIGGASVAHNAVAG